MKKAIFIILALVVVGGALYLWKGRKAEPEGGEQQTKLVEVQRGAITQSVESSGAIASNLDVEIKCRASGEIVSLPFEESDAVAKGALVLELDPQDEERNVNNAEVSLASTRARLEKSRRNLMIAQQELKNARTRAEVSLDAAKAKADEAAAKEARVKELLDRKLASKEEYDSARATAAQALADLEKARVGVRELKTQEDAIELNRQDVRVANADLESASINLGLARRRLGYTKVYAPISGVITQRLVQEGQIISSATSNVGGGTTIMTISDLSRLYVVSAVDESDIGSVRLGQEVEITADAFPERRLRGVVDRIAPKGENVSNVVTFEVRIEVLGPGAEGGPEGSQQGFKRPGSEARRGGADRRETFTRKTKEMGGGPGGPAALKPEMTANVKIIVAQKKNVLTVPAEAVSRERGRQTVEVDTGGGKTEKREVKTGISDGVNIEVESGLKEGEKVMVKENMVESMWRRGDSRRMPGPPGGPMMRRH